MSKQPQFGSAYEWVVKQVGGPVTEVDNVIAVSTSVVDILPGNGERVGAVIVNLGAGDCYISPIQTPSANLGVKLVASGGNISMTLRDDYTLQTRNWRAVCPSGGPSNVYVVEYYRVSQSG